MFYEFYDVPPEFEELLPRPQIPREKVGYITKR
jgi:hypothetical protein